MWVDPASATISVTRLDPRQFRELLDRGGHFVLDVRPQDFGRDASFIAGARLCPMVALAERYRTIPRDRPLLITDWAMKQSPLAAKFLLAKGYTVAGVLRGGMERWQAEQLPVERREPDSGPVLPESAGRD
jgi:rhodanese-related sulfurtransferase